MTIDNDKNLGISKPSNEEELKAELDNAKNLILDQQIKFDQLSEAFTRSEAEVLNLQKKLAEAMKLIEQLEKEVISDKLTGLFTEGYCHNRLSEMLALMKRNEGKNITFLFLDLDNFKQANDIEGHNVGDEILKRVAEIINSSVRASDVTARLHGDEFAVVMSEVSLERSEKIAERIRKKIETDPVLSSYTYPITATIGGYHLSPSSEESKTIDPSTIQKRANEALRVAKGSISTEDGLKGNKNVVYFYNKVKKN